MLLFHTTIVWCQNLVFNHSFEVYDVCVEELGGIPLIGSEDNFKPIGWYRPQQGHPDYFHACHPTPNFVSVPDNFGGFQQAYDGDGYIGLCTSADLLPNISYREYIQSKLNAPLVSGKEYFLNFWISSIDQNHTAYIDRVGAHFSKDSLYYPDTDNIMPGIEATIQSVSNRMLNDTQQWMSINGTFTSLGDESWITIGNFINTNNLNYELIDGIENDNFINSYYLLDNICLLDLEDKDAIISTHYLHKCPARITYLGIESESDFYYIWSDGSIDSSLKIMDTGMYWVKRIDLKNCQLLIDTFWVDNLPNGSIDIGVDTILCTGDSITLGQLIEHGQFYQWNTGENSPYITIHQTGVYAVHISDGCIFYNDTIRIDSLPHISFALPDDTLICKGAQIFISPTFFHSYLLKEFWNDDFPFLEREIKNEGKYIFQTLDYCKRTYSDTVFIKQKDCTICIEVPNAFSPNGDGLNDQFKILNHCLLQDFEMYIFNRWGERVYYSQRTDEGWDGTFLLKDCDVGVYNIWIVYKELESSEMKSFQSEIHLIR